MRIDVVFKDGNTEQIELATLPRIGEHIAFDDHDYEVSKVCHRVNPAETVATVTVTGHRVDGKYRSGQDMLPNIKFG